MAVCIFTRLVPDLVPASRSRTRFPQLVPEAGLRTRSRTSTHKVRTRYAQGARILCTHKVPTGLVLAHLRTRLHKVPRGLDWEHSKMQTAICIYH